MTKIKNTKQNSAALAGGGWEARVLPKERWLQREALRLRANARQSGCQPAAALGMGYTGNFTTDNYVKHSVFDTRSDVDKQFVFSFATLYHKEHKPQFFSRTGSAARVSCGVRYSTQETDAEPGACSHGINLPRVPSPLVVSGVDRMGGENLHKPLQHFEAACAVHTAIQRNYE